MAYTLDQVSFLLLCIQAAGGKIDFAVVTKEYERIHGTGNSSKSWAAMQYSRLKAKVELELSGHSAETDTKKRSAVEGNGTAKKKVKRADGKKGVYEKGTKNKMSDGRGVYDISDDDTNIKTEPKFKMETDK